MTTWRIARIGVVDLDTGEHVTRGHPRWAEWQEDLRLGVIPLPLPPTPPPTQDELDARAELLARQAIIADLRADGDIQALRTRTPAQVAAWIDANVTTLAQAKEVLKTLAKIVAFLARERYG